MARILDLTGPTGAYGTRLLAELGHDVVRIEAPGGDSLRALHPHVGSAPDAETGAFHQFMNAGKRSVALDPETDKGRSLLLALAAKADAVVASLPLPVDEAALTSANKSLILVRLDDTMPELCAFARSGLLAITGQPDGKPVVLGGHLALSAVGVYVALAAIAALFGRGDSGAGQVVDVSAPQALATLAEQVWNQYGATGETLERLGSQGGATALAGALECADGYWMVSVPRDPKGWENFVKLVPHPAFTNDPKLADWAERRKRKSEVLGYVAEWSRTQKRDEIVARAQDLDFPCAPVLSPLDLTRDPQLVARGFLREIEHPQFGKISFPIGALANVWNRTLSFAPKLGKDTDAVLAELGAGAN
jgi:crotonobetainyl-CoA:carnitine CoA-transferase CaiB-like acyl-CoA transferase